MRDQEFFDKVLRFVELSEQFDDGCKTWKILGL